MGYFNRKTYHFLAMLSDVGGIKVTITVVVGIFVAWINGNDAKNMLINNLYYKRSSK